MRRGELEGLLIDVGVDILVDEGMATGTERLTFKRVFDRAWTEHGVKVSTGSVIGRIWDDMAHYQAAVLAEVLANEDREGVEDTITAVERVLAAADLSSRGGRMAAMAEAVRVGCATHIGRITRSRTASLHMGLRGLSVSRLPNDAASPVSDAAKAAYEEYCVRWDYVFERSFDALGLRPVAGVSIRHLSMLAVSVTEGYTTWDRLDPAVAGHVERPTGTDGALEEWTLYSLGIDGLIRGLTRFAEDVD